MGRHGRRPHRKRIIILPSGRRGGNPVPEATAGTNSPDATLAEGTSTQPTTPSKATEATSPGPSQTQPIDTNGAKSLGTDESSAQDGGAELSETWRSKIRTVSASDRMGLGPPTSSISAMLPSLAAESADETRSDSSQSETSLSSASTLPDKSAGESSSNKSGTIAGVVGALLLIAAFAAIGAFYWWRKKKQGKHGLSFQDRQHNSYIVDNVSEKSVDDKPDYGGPYQQHPDGRSYAAYNQPSWNQSETPSQPNDATPLTGQRSQYASTPMSDSQRPIRELAGDQHQSSYFAPRPLPSQAQDPIEPLKLVDRGSQGFFKSNAPPAQPSTQGQLFPPIRDTAYGPEIRNLVQDPDVGGITLADAWSRPMHPPSQGQLPLPPKGSSASPAAFMDNWSKPPSKKVGGHGAKPSEATLSFLSEWAGPGQAGGSSQHPQNLQAGPRTTAASTAGFSRHLADQASYFQRGSMGSSGVGDEHEVLRTGGSRDMSSVRIGERQFIPSMSAPPVPELNESSYGSPRQQNGPVSILKKGGTRVPPAVMRESESPQSILNYINDYSNTNTSVSHQTLPSSGNSSAPKKSHKGRK